MKKNVKPQTPNETNSEFENFKELASKLFKMSKDDIKPQQDSSTSKTQKTLKTRKNKIASKSI